MAYKVKNDTTRKIGVTTPGGIFTVAAGKSREFDDVMNLSALKNHEGVTVSGEKTEKPEDGQTQLTVNVNAIDPKVEVKNGQAPAPTTTATTDAQKTTPAANKSASGAQGAKTS